MDRICDLKKCAGCYACANICPKKCITMVYDEHGILLPSIDHDKCVDCKACQNVCPVNHPVEKRKAKKAYAAWHLDENTRKRSASGGAAMAFYETMVEKSGVCFGTRFDKNLDLMIQTATTLDEVHEFKGSKYVQAMVGNSYSETKAFLDQGKEVLYVGPPCQIAGLNNYLRKDYSNLVTVDLICHGVPSIKYLKDHVNDIQKNLEKQVDNVTFRGAYSFELALFHEGELLYRKDRFLDSYFTGFLNGLFYRENCYSCPYACDERVSDLTIGDFWGLGTESPCEYTIGNGVSVIIPNTEKGQAFLMEASKRLFVDERPVLEAIHGNAQLMHPSERNANNERFMKLYKENGFHDAAWECTKEDIEAYKKSTKHNFLKRCVRKTKRVLK